jgi:beta-ureidopropionase / N-carbamoyl-L-amino-acid hydrolase
VKLDTDRLLARLHALGEVGATDGQGRTRLALTNEDRLGRDLVVAWLHEAGAEVSIDAVGNIHGVLHGTGDEPPVMTGSHIDTVRRAGALDGCYGVVAGIEVLDAMQRAGVRPRKALIVTAFTNEEGVRYMPDLLGSRVLTKEMSVADALALVSTDGQRFGEELQRIGYAGALAPWDHLPGSFVELHIEQGPVLDATGTQIGVVEGVQGYSWWTVAVTGRANHAGTTPMHLRQDAGSAAMGLAQHLVQLSATEALPAVATVGTFRLEPGSINVVPGKASFTLDLRDPDDRTLSRAEAALSQAVAALRADGFGVQAERGSHHPAVRFSAPLCDGIEAAAARRGLSSRRMVSGASHDAQMMARVCPTAMVFVPSRGGVSHNPAEHSEPQQLIDGAQVLLDMLAGLVGLAAPISPTARTDA